MRLLRHDPLQGYLVVALAVENAPADRVAGEVSMSSAQVVG